MVTKKLLFFFFTLVNCAIAFGGEKIGDDLFKGGIGFDKDLITNVPPSLGFQKREEVCTNYSLSVRTFYLVDGDGKKIKYDDQNNIIPVEDHYNHKKPGKYRTVVNHSGGQEAAPVLIKVITSSTGEIMYSIEDEGGTRNLATFEVESQKTKDFLVQLETLATEHRSNLVFLQLYDNRTRSAQKIEIRQDQLLDAQAKTKKLLEEKHLAANPAIQKKPKKRVLVPKNGHDSLKDALALLEPSKDQNFSLEDFQLPHRTSDISPSDYYNNLPPKIRKAYLSVAYNYDLQKVARDSEAFSKMADMSPKNHYSQLSEEKRQEFHQAVYDLHEKKNTDAKKILFHNLSLDLKKQLEQWNDPGDEQKKAELVSLVTRAFYACHDNDDLRLDFESFSTKLSTAIRNEEKSKDGNYGHGQVQQAAKSAPLTNKFVTISNLAQHRIKKDLPLRAKCIEATNKINANTAELEQENNKHFGHYVKDSVRKNVIEVALPVVVEEVGECIGLALASFINNPATKKEIVRLEKDVQDLKQELTDNDIEKYKKDLNKELFQKLQANEKLINGDKSKKTNTKEELLQAFKDFNEHK